MFYGSDELLYFLGIKEEGKTTGLEPDLDEALEFDTESDVPISGSPLYPRIYTGDSAKPLMNGMFPESEYVDDNIHGTWQGIMSYYG